MYLRLLLICSISLVFLSLRKSEKIPYTRFQSVCMQHDMSLNLNSYQNIFIMHVGFCASTEYCNERMIDYIQERKDEKTLVIYDMKDKEYTKLLSSIEGVYLHYIDRAYLQKHAIFSVYNIHINKKRVSYLY